MKTHGNVRSLEVVKAERRVLEAVRLARLATREKQSQRIHDLAGDVLTSGKVRLNAERMVDLLFDAFKRGADQSVVEGVVESLHAAIRSWYKTQDAPVPFDIAHLHEEEAEARLDIAEARFRIEKSGPALQELMEARRAHALKSEAQVRAAEQMVWGGVA